MRCRRDKEGWISSYYQRLVTQFRRGLIELHKKGKFLCSINSRISIRDWLNGLLFIVYKYMFNYSVISINTEKKKNTYNIINYKNNFEFL